MATVKDSFELFVFEIEPEPFAIQFFHFARSKKDALGHEMKNVRLLLETLLDILGNAACFGETRIGFEFHNRKQASETRETYLAQQLVELVVLTRCVLD